MSAASISQSLLVLPVAERVAIADQLYASVPENWQRETDHAWLNEAGRRSAEMDENPEMELSHEEFLAGIQINQGQA
ncbi:MAG: addiction module protein [Verrucomicrobiaceae bacterium]|nr:addiction module protein [Verrucomicrobiaceae bacterium]